MKMLRIKNWDKYQHYKAGRGTPPWIKLHTKIFSSMEWLCASDATRLSMLCCLVVGAMHDGCVPDDSKMIKDVAHLNWRVDLEALKSLGFLEEMLADASTLLADASTRELRSRETQEERESKSALAKDASASPAPPDGGAPASASGRKGNRRDAAAPPGFAEFWLAYPRKVSKAAAMRVFGQVMRSGVTLDTIMAALNAQKPHWHDPQFIKHPATWLSKGCWEDVVEQPRKWSPL